MRTLYCKFCCMSTRRKRVPNVLMYKHFYQKNKKSSGSLFTLAASNRIFGVVYSELRHFRLTVIIIGSGWNIMVGNEHLDLFEAAAHSLFKTMPNHLLDGH